MATMLPWTSIEIGDLEIFAPAPPCLLVNTSYIDGEPESSVTYFWQDAETGLLNHEVLFLQPVGFDEALAWAQDHAATKSIARIHVKHTRPAASQPRRMTKGRTVGKAKPRQTRATVKRKVKARKRRA